MGPVLRRVRVRAWGFAAAGVACAALAATFACISAPPPSPPLLQTCRPSIEQASVQPPPPVITAWPSQFVVPVSYFSCDPTDGFYYEAFVDFDPNSQTATEQLSPQLQAYALNGGDTMVEVGLPKPTDDYACHRIEILVAHGFSPIAPHTWDSIKGDIVTWWYSPTGQVGGCPEFDAGNGQFPDAASDTLFVPDGGPG